MPRHKLFTPILKAEFDVTSFQDPARMTEGLYPDIDPAKRVDKNMKVIPLYQAPGPNGEPYTSHVGVDFATPVGTPVYAAYDGKIWIGPNTGTQGNYFLLCDGPEEMTYAHLSTISVLSGQYVKAGDLLGKTGASGYTVNPSTGAKQPLGAHLHVHMARRKQIIDAFPFIFPDTIKVPEPTPAPAPQKPEGEVDKDGKTLYRDTDPFEYTLKKPLNYTVDTSFGRGINVRERPQRIYKVMTTLSEKTKVQIDKRADFPDGQIWGRLKDRPWHWVCIYDPYAHWPEKGEWYLITEK